MRLLITDEIVKEVSFDIVIMSSSEFNNIHSHPFIASSRFDEVVVDMRANVNLGYLQPLLRTTKVIPKVVGELNMHAVSLLCEIYKDRAAEIRITYIKDKAGFAKLIDDMKKQYQWEQFY